jgi:hypothetical protein
MPPRRRPHRSPRPVRAARARALAVLLPAVLAAGCGTSAGENAAARATSTTPAAEAVPHTVATTPGFLRPAEVRPGPTRLRIDGIGVDVDVVPVGVDEAGDMQVPGPTVAGWYEFGPRPGEPGSALLAAHVDYDGRPGAFFRLREVAPGDRVEVSGPDGTPLTLAVTEVTRVPKAGLAATGAFDRSGPARVVLVTCGGPFDRARRSYEDNVVARAEPVR